MDRRGKRGLTAWRPIIDDYVTTASGYYAAVARRGELDMSTVMVCAAADVEEAGW